jgi:predicted phage terminase large subunit-like protein
MTVKGRTSALDFDDDVVETPSSVNDEGAESAFDYIPDGSTEITPENAQIPSNFDNSSRNFGSFGGFPDEDIDLSGLNSLKLSEAVRLTPATFAHYITGGRWVPAPHLLYVSSILARDLVRGNARDIISCPPRHGKSELISVNTPIWWLDRFPHTNVLLTSYSSELSTGFSRRVRDTILALSGGAASTRRTIKHGKMIDTSSHQGFLRVHLREDTLQVDQFQTTLGGNMFAVGIGGATTGRGAHLLLIDDYLKNAKEASSKTIRDSHWDWFVSTAMSRLEPGGNAAVIATRWDPDDLIGRILLSEDADEWTVVVLPALAWGPDDPEFTQFGADPIGRAPGEALWPERYSRSRLLKIKRLVGSYFWDSLYQQNPKRRGNYKVTRDMLEGVDESQLPKVFFRTTRSWDLAGTKGGGDYTVGSLVSRKGEWTYLRNQVRGQWSSQGVESRMRSTAEADGYDVLITIEQEPGAAGKAYAEHLQNNVLKGFRVRVVPSSGDKFLRAQPMYAACEAGTFRYVYGDWNNQFFDELEMKGEYDDCVDSAGLGYQTLWSRFKGSPIWGRNRNAQTTARSLVSPGSLISGAVFGRGT